MNKKDIKRPPAGRKWWQRPGLGIMYQIEYRPGWAWKRDFVRFKDRMRNKQGRLKFNGPFCKIDKWVALSREHGVDFHVMEIKCVC